ncbi:hypothetical protein K504DRAFT_494439 [Pleomassaria siparia CBS 279.74]|uniref:Uncharacterized protein n=1 Tax=Pleomassaria siparia CBS 279.74 TaxID=1314801 RepID=A0A6G1JWV0_9PLEO|nr:hypothetical protein K504DRAFT_494439 [Pleomassaria siparia CBS 279.74]
MHCRYKTVTKAKPSLMFVLQMSINVAHVQMQLKASFAAIMLLAHVYYAEEDIDVVLTRRIAALGSKDLRRKEKCLTIEKSFQRSTRKAAAHNLVYSKKHSSLRGRFLFSARLLNRRGSQTCIKERDMTAIGEVEDESAAEATANKQPKWSCDVTNEAKKPKT